MVQAGSHSSMTYLILIVIKLIESWSLYEPYKQTHNLSGLCLIKRLNYIYDTNNHDYI